MQTFSKTLVVLLSLGVAGYATYAYGLLPLGSLVHPDMQANFIAHPVGIYTHVFASILALVIGPFQFFGRREKKHWALHQCNQKGLTLMELIAALVLIAIFAALAVPRYVDLEKSARLKAIDSGVKELNSLEILTWSDHKISGSGYSSDTRIFESINYDLGSDYTWNTGDPKLTGGTMSFDGELFTLSRRASTPGSPAIWDKSP